MCVGIWSLGSADWMCICKSHLNSCFNSTGQVCSLHVYYWVIMHISPSFYNKVRILCFPLPKNCWSGLTFLVFDDKLFSSNVAVCCFSPEAISQKRIQYSLHFIVQDCNFMLNLAIFLWHTKLDAFEFNVHPFRSASLFKRFFSPVLSQCMSLLLIPCMALKSFMNANIKSFNLDLFLKNITSFNLGFKKITPNLIHTVF